MIKRVDSGGQVHLVTNIRKPRKWRRYEYLLSDGNSYINTNYLYDSTNTTYKIKTKFSLPTNVGKYDAIFGAYTDERSKTLRIIRGNSNSAMWSYYNTMAGGGICANITTSNSNIREVLLTSSQTIVTENGSTTTYTHPAVNGSNTTSKFYLFCQGTSSGSISCKSKSRIYYFKLYDNNTLVRDFVPAQYNGEYGMWDLVEDKFYRNAGTGTFTVGPEMKNYDEIYEVRKANSILPAGVELYDYILSSGTLYIDTKYVPNNTSGIYLRAYCTTSGGNYLAIGCRQTSGDTRWWINYSTTLELSWNTWTATATDYTNTWTEIEHNYKNSRSAKVNGTVYSVSYPTLANITYSAYLFNSCKYGNPGTGFIGRISNAKITEGTTIVRNFLPCTYLGEPGMWDTVENKFYRNQGTGLFTLGSKITLKEYEYLLTNATKLSIYTGILLTDNHSIVYDIIFKYENNGVRRLMGPSGLSGSYFGANSNGKYDRYSSISIGNIDHLYEEFNLITKKLVAYINDFKYRENSITAANSIGHCYIFSLNGINNYTGAGQYFYSGKMVYDGKVIRDFIPVSYNGTPGLWDKVEWKFYGNAGSGSFTLGPEKKSGICYVHEGLTNLFNGFVGGGQMTLSNGILVGTGSNADTYFYTKTTQAINTTSYYLVGLYVQGYSSASPWNFLSPQNNSTASIKIIRDGWNWGYVKFTSAASKIIWDDAGTRPSPVPKITISDCRIYKIT